MLQGGSHIAPNYIYIPIFLAKGVIDNVTITSAFQYIFIKMHILQQVHHDF